MKEKSTGNDETRREDKQKVTLERCYKRDGGGGGRQNKNRRRQKNKI